MKQTNMLMSLGQSILAVIFTITLKYIGGIPTDGVTLYFLILIYLKLSANGESK